MAISLLFVWHKCLSINESSLSYVSTPSGPPLGGSINTFLRLDMVGHVFTPDPNYYYAGTTMATDDMNGNMCIN